MKNLKIYLIFIFLFIAEFTQAQAPKKQTLSFVISEDEISKVYTMNTEGQNRLFLAKGGHSRFSPDGGKLALGERLNDRE